MKKVCDGWVDVEHPHLLPWKLKCLEHGFPAIRIQQLCQCKKWRKQFLRDTQNNGVKEEKEVFLQVQLVQKALQWKYDCGVCIHSSSMTFTVMFYIYVGKKKVIAVTASSRDSGWDLKNQAVLSASHTGPNNKAS